MLKMTGNTFMAMLNPDTQNFIQNFSFYIYEAKYTEFQEDYQHVMVNTGRQKPNTLYYILDGECTVSDDHGFSVTAKAGEIMFLPINATAGYRVACPKGTKKIVIGLFVNLFTIDDLFSTISEPRKLQDTYHIVPKVCEAILSDQPYEQLMLTPLVRLSIEPLFREINDTLKSLLMRSKKYDPIFGYLHKNLYIDLTLEQISKHTGFSVHVLSHKFPEETGFTIKRYMKEQILRSVCHDLAYTELRMTDIALKYHFSTESYFSRWFRKQYQWHPTEYRNVFWQKAKRHSSFYQ